MSLVHLWISSSALDTDFTAKLIDVHPPNDDYPDGFGMLLVDSVIRCRYREGFEREVLLEPGMPVPVTISLWATSNLFYVGHRIRVDISSSNWPRLDVNPNTGEPMGRHTHQVVAEQTVCVDAERPSRIVLPVIRRSTRCFRRCELAAGRPAFIDFVARSARKSGIEIKDWCQ